VTFLFLALLFCATFNTFFKISRAFEALFKQSAVPPPWTCLDYFVFPIPLCGPAYHGALQDPFLLAFSLYIVIVVDFFQPLYFRVPLRFFLPSSPLFFSSFFPPRGEKLDLKGFFYAAKLAFPVLFGGAS